MQIVLATTARTRGGVWRHVEDLATGLQKAGHSVIIAVVPQAPELKRAAVLAGLETRDFRETIRWRDWLWHGHLHDTYDRAFLEAALQRRPVGATVLTEHLPHTNASDPRLQPGPRRPLAGPAKTLMKRLQYRLVDRVIAVSPSSRAFLIDRYGQGVAPIDVVMHGVAHASDVDLPDARSPALVLGVGALIYQKGFDVLVSAAAAQPVPSWHAVVLGDGPAREALVRQAANRGMVSFAGWSDDVESAMAGADIVCMPSRWESAGYAALEAMAAGRPVVASDVDGLRDIVEHGITGLLVSPEDPTALGFALNRLATSGALRSEMGRAGRARASEFTIARMVEETVSVYGEATAKGRPKIARATFSRDMPTESRHARRGAAMRDWATGTVSRMGLADRRPRNIRYRIRKAAAEEALKRAGAVLNKTVLTLDYPPNARNVPRYTKPLPSLVERIAAGDHRYGEVLAAIAGYSEDLGRIELRDDDPLSPSWINGFLPGLDGAAIYAFLRDRGPARYVEIGSGNSTMFAARARTDGGLATHFTSVDPFPRAEIDTLCDDVIRLPFEQIDQAVFRSLTAGDIVFMDGSHRVFMNNDVVAFFLETLPSLPSGVLVGIHDVYLPFDYPSDIAHRYYSEQYLLAAYLLGKPPVDIVFPAHYAFTALRSEVEALWRASPRFEGIEHHGVAFWFETK
jgi:glycosyltransferase involved in cell wall biosynthesis